MLCFLLVKGEFVFNMNSNLFIEFKYLNILFLVLLFLLKLGVIINVSLFLFKNLYGNLNLIYVLFLYV